MEASRSFSKLRFLAVGFSGLFFLQAEASGLLDLGQLRGFKLTEVFHTLKAWNRQNRQCLVPAAHGKVIYPVTTSLDELELRFQKLDPKIKNKASGSIYVHNNLLFKYYILIGVHFLPDPSMTLVLRFRHSPDASLLRILLYTALEASDILQITAPDGYDFAGNWQYQWDWESKMTHSISVEKGRRALGLKQPAWLHGLMIQELSVDLASRPWGNSSSCAKYRRLGPPWAIE